MSSAQTWRSAQSDMAYVSFSEACNTVDNCLRVVITVRVTDDRLGDVKRSFAIVLVK